MGRGWETSLFDRAEILNTLTKRFAALSEGYRQNVALLGPPAIGKTAIVTALVGTLRAQRAILPVYFEVRPEPLGAFAGRWVGSLCSQALWEGGGAAPADPWARLQPELVRRCPRTAARVSALRGAGKPAEEQFSQLFELPALLSADLGLPLLLILEEFQHLEALGARRPFHLLGKQLMVDRSVAYLVTSSAVKEARLILQEKLDLLFGRFEQLEVSPFDTATSLAFLCHRLEGVEMAPELQRFLAALCGGHPWYLDLISGRLRDVVVLHRSSMVTRDLLWEVLGELLQDPHGRLSQAFLARLAPLLQVRTRHALVPLLLAVAGGETRPATLAAALRRPAQAVMKEAARLAELGFVQRFGVLYTITDPLFRWWLMHCFRERQESWAPLATAGAQRFKAVCDQRLSEFVDELRRSLPERMAELFRAFRGDEIALNGEPRRRVGPFQRVEHQPWGADGCQVTALAGRRETWVCAVKRRPIVDEDVAAFLELTRRTPEHPVAQRVLVALDGVELNARLRAKEAHVWMWDGAAISTLLALYGKAHVIT